MAPRRGTSKNLFSTTSTRNVGQAGSRTACETSSPACLTVPSQPEADLPTPARKGVPVGTERSAGKRFDRDHGVTTQALLFLSELDGAKPNEAYAHATHYEPVGIAAFRELLATLPEATIRSSTFVDLGAGMGRALLLASEYPFKQIFGVELSPALYVLARENLDRAQGFEMRCRDLRVAPGDARKQRYPKGNLVVFLFNPFDGEVLRAVLARMIRTRSSGDDVYLLYHTPVHRDVIETFAAETIAQPPDGLVVRLKHSPERPDPSESKC
jgi:SAM-dependent methyltransferase